MNEAVKQKQIVGSMMPKWLRFTYFMQHGMWNGGSSWNWKRIFCWFGWHNLSDYCKTDINFDSLIIHISCNRCLGSRSFRIGHNDLFYKMLGALNIGRREIYREEQLQELNKQFEKCAEELKSKIKTNGN